MLPDPADTIVAQSSPHGAGARAIVRMSGPASWTIAGTFFPDISKERPAERLLHPAMIVLPNLASGLPGDLYFWPAPRSYTGQDVLEIHTLAAPPLIDLLITHCLNAGARAAQPGEFTLRAFLAGKVDLTKAEAILGVIEAVDRYDLKNALLQLAGGIGQPLQELRDDLLNLLADVEAGLDFAEEDLEFIRQKDLLDRLTRALAMLTLVRRQIEQRATTARPFRAVLAGPPNAGKSSLFNALAGKDAAIVSPRSGTTRDYLEATLFVGGIQVAVVDTAGLRCQDTGPDAAAQALGKEQATTADALVWCLEADSPVAEDWTSYLSDVPPARVVTVATKCDRAAAPPDALGTSALTGAGVEELRRELAQRARGRPQPAIAPSLSRCRHHVDACLAHLRQAHSTALNGEGAELLALELRGALDELGAMVGAIYTDDLLERIFSRFCVGK